MKMRKCLADFVCAQAMQNRAFHSHTGLSVSRAPHACQVCMRRGYKGCAVAIPYRAELREQKCSPRWLYEPVW